MLNNILSLFWICFFSSFSVVSALKPFFHLFILFIHNICTIYEHISTIYMIHIIQYFFYSNPLENCNSWMLPDVNVIIIYKHDDNNVKIKANEMRIFFNTHNNHVILFSSPHSTLFFRLFRLLRIRILYIKCARSKSSDG